MKNRLHVAAWGSHIEIVKLLISKGADVNAKDGDGWKPLHVVASNGCTKTAELLISKDADVNTKDGMV